MQTLEKVHPKFLELKTRLSEIDDINSAVSLLYWDQATYMPPGGAAARGRQLATLRQIAHAKLTDGTIAHLLDELQSYEAELPYDSDEASLLRITRRISEQALQVPASFVAKFSQHRTESYQVWATARSQSNFALVQPYLEKMLEFSREWANFFPGYEHIADPLIDSSDYGMKATDIRAIFADLRSQLVPIVQAITAQAIADDSCLHRHYPEADQLAFSLKVLEQMGYDFQRGRQDKTLHPFMTNFSIGDVRITTRVYETDLNQGLFSTIHEMGHALYEQGNPIEFEGTPLAGGVSSGVHESQSRLWENLVGRSRRFWNYVYSQLQAAFPTQLGEVPLETFYRAINKVARSLIRTDADEVTYNLHVMIRFDLELDLLDGKLAVKDLPAAWNDRYESDLGVVPHSDSEGVLQDVHWYTSRIGGMFQGYTLGNLMSAQFFEAALAAHPDIPNQIEHGNFTVLHDWLKDNVYRQGCKFTPSELLDRATGSALSAAPLMRHIRQKYGELYAL
ncbi:carboxypeptidase M32 [Leptolyngbya sp. FACHB-36]|uniref:carboxypeptidase M32 n=1 Tax=Leptolyngbya sp. FACHB-36 TaxID=2692808 RepID=UPI001680F2FF|nr:carboxypeptidase M32 [Leptolyngbya sp. FACHB-36]MBD2021812.1 carboxypeptidase M32 [Leptolyngbya sp. FACHB-36]